jgi:hypothetical protein
MHLSYLTEAAQVWGLMQVVVNMVINIWGPQNAGSS